MNNKYQNGLPRGLVSNTNATIEAVDIYADAEQTRIYPRQIATGTMRGAQNIGYGSAQIDSSNNRVVLSNSDGSSVGLGTIPDDSGDFGFFSTDANGNVIMKIVLGTFYTFDLQTLKNFLQLGTLPDGSQGFEIAPPGMNVEDAYS